MAIGGSEIGPLADSPTTLTNSSARCVATPGKTPSGSSPKVPGRPPAGAEPWSCRATPVLAALAATPSRARKALRQRTIPRGTGPCLPLASVGICGATPRRPSCYGRRRSSTLVVRQRLAALGRLRQRCPTWLPTARTAARASSCPTSFRTLWQTPGGWTTTPYAASSLGTGAASGIARIPAAFLHLEERAFAAQPLGSGPHAGLSKLAHRLPRILGGRQRHPWAVDRVQDFRSGCFVREEQLPFLPRWPEDWVPRHHCWLGGSVRRTERQPRGPGRPCQRPRPGEGPGAAALRTEGGLAGAVGGSGGHGVEPPRSGGH